MLVSQSCPALCDPMYLYPTLQDPLSTGFSRQEYWSGLPLLLLLSHFSQQPTRLPRPWDSPVKNTGVGCHFLLQCMKVKSESEVAQSCPTPSDPMDCSPPGPSVHGIFQGKVLEWGAIAFSEGSPYLIAYRRAV